MADTVSQCGRWCGVVIASMWLSASFADNALAADANAKKPNVLFLFSDDQRADTVAAWGNTHIRTPNVDKLVAEGTSFTRTYCMGGNNGAICMPSRAMLMSGRTLFRIKENLDGQGTWPEQFGKAGYRTFATGKWHNGQPALVRSFQEGKNVFLGGMGDPFKLPVGDILPGGKMTPKHPSVTHSCQLFADAAVEFVGSQKGDKPFLCYVAFNLPHDPKIASESLHAEYNAAKPPLPANFMPMHPFDNGEMTIRDEKLAPWPRTPEIVQQHLADYYAATAFVDLQVGRILDALKKSGQYDNTIIVYSSDHGLAIGSHGLMGKQNLYDHSMRAPLVIAGPGVPKGKTTDAMCYLLDIFPTLGELSGVAGPDGSEGKSLVPVMQDQTPDCRPAILTAYRNIQRAVRDDRWKLIVYPQINKVQLFDLKADPAEVKDLSADPAHARQLAEMMALLKVEQEAAGDTQALTSEKPKPAEWSPKK